MVFNSFPFINFFAVVAPLIILLHRHVKARNIVLLAASYYFYGSWDWRFLGLIASSTLLDYTVSLKLDSPSAPTHIKPARSARDHALLLTSLVFNLGLLAVFKYFNFFTDSLVSLLQLSGISVHARTFNIILPVGISFYTFQTLSYTVDVYLGRIRAEQSLLTYATYLSMFPQLVAGPIERASNLLPQLNQPTTIDLERIWRGFYLMSWGLFKKVVIADNMATIVDTAFATPAANGTVYLLGIYAFAIQIYGDFSGYTDIARGTAKVIGFEFPLNFRQPYLSLNPSEFWRRWHISLSTWLRDYLYILLGGNRHGEIRTYVNLMITMVLGGLWHGAAWTFVCWGVFHGAILAIHRILRRPLEFLGQRFQQAPYLWLAVRWLAFFHLTCLGWLLFRAESMAQVQEMLTSIFTQPSFDIEPLPKSNLLGLAASVAILVPLEIAQERTQDECVVLELPIVVRALIYAAGFLALICFGNLGGREFVYFQF
ncbi:MAG: MBOAT family protein [Planctomycetales bacterium]|nr:MBOAT family protein [Planctomycetales bacterium]